MTNAEYRNWKKQQKITDEILKKLSLDVFSNLSLVNQVQEEMSRKKRQPWWKKWLSLNDQQLSLQKKINSVQQPATYWTELYLKQDQKITEISQKKTPFWVKVTGVGWAFSFVRRKYRIQYHNAEKKRIQKKMKKLTKRQDGLLNEYINVTNQQNKMLINDNAEIFKDFKYIDMTYEDLIKKDNDLNKQLTKSAKKAIINEKTNYVRNEVNKQVYNTNVQIEQLRTANAALKNAVDRSKNNQQIEELEKMVQKLTNENYVSKRQKDLEKWNKKADGLEYVIDKAEIDGEISSDEAKAVKAYSKYSKTIDDQASKEIRKAQLARIRQKIADQQQQKNEELIKSKLKANILEEARKSRDNKNIEEHNANDLDKQNQIDNSINPVQPPKIKDKQGEEGRLA